MTRTLPWQTARSWHVALVEQRGTVAFLRPASAATTVEDIAEVAAFVIAEPRRTASAVVVPARLLPDLELVGQRRGLTLARRSATSATPLRRPS